MEGRFSSILAQPNFPFTAYGGLLGCLSNDGTRDSDCRAGHPDYGTSGFLRRLSDPFWSQSHGAVMGMDWHSSGITTSVLGALNMA